MEPENPYRLPRVAIPSRYEITLAPDLENATFAGEVSITVEVVEPTREIVLNAAELEIREANVVAGATAYGATIETDAEQERVTFTTEYEIPAGPAAVNVTFDGALNDKLRGFYRATFVDDAGKKQILATSQCESTDARRAFPCFDEPDFKAGFAISLVVDEKLIAVSNGAEAEAEPLGDGRVRVRFEETMPMSTYLVAFVVGDLEITDPIDVDGTPLRVVHQPGKGHLTQFALDVGAHALRYFESYYGIAYPGGKLDLVAVPDFAFGAMENLGCVIFREALLLVDPDTITQAERIRVADVVCHEIAHMWFGDLVTMAWWNGIWLNEAFATFMEIAAADAYEPAWRRWEQFGIERSAAFGIDALGSTRPVEYEVRSPADAEGMFDVLTYQKGGSVLRMLEQYLGEEVYRDGIRSYLAAHAYANTETTDLWDALEAASSEPVRAMMDTWIFQGGFPVIDVSRLGDRRIRVSQRRFTYSGDDSEQSWIVPLLVRAEAGAGQELHKVALTGEAAEIELAAAPDRIVANAGGHGFYRVHYTGDLFAALLEGHSTLEAVERYNLVDDAWASVLAGDSAALDFLELASRFANEPRVDVWRAVIGGLGSISRLIDGDVLERYRGELTEIFSPSVDRLGWQASEDDDELTRELRATMLRSQGVLAHDAETRARAREVHSAYIEDPSGTDPDVISACVSIVADAGTAGDYETYLDRFENAPTPQEQLRYLLALAEFPGEAELERTLAMTLTDTIRSQNAPFVIARALGHRDHGGLAWRFIAENWDALVDRFASGSIVRMLSGIRSLAHFGLEDDVVAFFETHDPPSGERTLRQYLELLHVTAALRARESERLAESL